MTQQDIKSENQDIPTDVLSESENAETGVELEVGGELIVEPIDISKDSPNTSNKKKESLPGKHGVILKKTPNPSVITSHKPALSTGSQPAGTSKSTSKTSAASSTRKPTSATTTSSTGHNPPSKMAGGSGDEKKKTASPASRRSFLGPTSQNISSKPDSSAERRGASGSNVRKSVTSSSTVSSRPVTKSNNTTVKSTSNRISASSTTLKSPTSGTFSESMKRLSINSVSTNPNKPVSRASVLSSKELDDLKVNLANCEIKMNAQAAEIVNAQSRYDNLNKKLAEEIQRFNLLDKEIRKEHDELVEKLHSKYKHDLQELEAELEKAQSASNMAQVSISRSIEETQQRESVKSAELIRNLKDEYELSLSALKSEIDNSQDAYKSASSALSESETRIKSLETKILQAAEHLKSLESEHQEKMTLLEQALAKKHEAAVSDLLIEYQEKSVKDCASLESAHQKIVADLTRQYDEKIKDLQTNLLQCKDDAATAQAILQQSLETHATESLEKITNLESELKILRSEATKSMEALNKSFQENQLLDERLRSLQKDVEKDSEKYKSLFIENEGLKEKLSSESQALAITRDDMDQVRAQLIEQTEMMNVFHTDGKIKDELFDKIQSDFNCTKKELEEKKSYIIRINDEHLQTIQELSSGYEQKMNDLQGNSITLQDFDDLRNKNEDLIKSHQELRVSHQNELNELKKSHNKELSRLQKSTIDLENEIKEREFAHENSLKEANSQSIHSPNSSDPAKTHDIKVQYGELISLLKEHTKSLSISPSNNEKIQDTFLDLREQVRELWDSLAKTLNDFGINDKGVPEEKIEILSLSTQTDASQKKSFDNSTAHNLIEQELDQDEKESRILGVAIKDNNEELLETKNALKHLLEKQAMQEENFNKEYNDLKENLNKMIEEANWKASLAESRLKELEAILKLKEAEITEVRIMASNKSSSTTNELAHGDQVSITDLEGEQDDSSAVLKFVWNPISLSQFSLLVLVINVINRFSSKIAQFSAFALQMEQDLNKVLQYPAHNREFG